MTSSAINQVKMPRYIQTELGKERLCKHCEEYWPYDDEFWLMRRNRTGDTSQYSAIPACRGCYNAVYRKIGSEPKSTTHI